MIEGRQPRLTMEQCPKDNHDSVQTAAMFAVKAGKAKKKTKQTKRGLKIIRLFRLFRLLSCNYYYFELIRFLLEVDSLDGRGVRIHRSQAESFTVGKMSDVLKRH